MNLPLEAEVLDSGALEVSGSWVAAITYRLPGVVQTQDMFRTFTGPEAESAARNWLVDKLTRRS